MECRKKVLSKFAAGFRHAFDLLATRFLTRFAAGWNNGMRLLQFYTTAYIAALANYQYGRAASGTVPSHI